MFQARFSRLLPLVAATCGAGFLAASGAQAAAPLHSFHAPRALGTTLDVQVATRNPQAAAAACDAVQLETVRLEAMLSTRIPTSFITRINLTNAPVVVPPEVIELLAAYQKASAFTCGLISPFMGELSARWSQAARENRLPTADELAAIVSRMRQTTLDIDAEHCTVRRIGPATLNIDALGKPFILQKATRYAWAHTHGLSGLLVNIGGEIMTVGSPDVERASTPWSVAVANPRNFADNAAPLGTLAMTQGAVATSGDYARPRVIEGQGISHILNPLTGLPAAHALAATVMHQDAILANVLATSFCVAGPEAAHLAQRANAEFLLSRADSPVQVSRKLPFAADAAAPNPAANFPNDFKVSIPVTVIAPTNTSKPDRACLAVWIEDDKGQPVKTLAFWGNDRYATGALKQWSALGVQKPATVATKNAGTYTIEWDGTDSNNKAVPQGTYTVRIELAYRYNGHSAAKTTVTCGAAASTAAVNKNGSIDASTVTYGPPAKPAP